MKKRKSTTHTLKLNKETQKLLERYCAINNVSQNIAIKRIINLYLKDLLPPIEEAPENQLGLFDPVQIEMF